MRTTISAKGQITVPIAVRKALGLHPGTKLEVRIGGEGEFVVSKARNESFFAKFKGTGKKSLWRTSEEAIEALRGRVMEGDVDREPAKKG